jgi:hypothetical protein
MMSRQFFHISKKFIAIKDQVHGVFERSPRLANAITGFATFSVGDFLVQRYELNSIEQVDFQRCLNLGTLGIVMNGYFLVSWYGILDRFIGRSMRCLQTVSMKVVADQVVFAPFTIGAFFGVSGLVRYSNPTEVVNYFESKMKNNFWSTFIADCTIWPLMNVVNFKFIPLIYRPAFTAVVQLVWQSYLSAVADNKNIKLNHSAPAHVESKCVI